MTADVHVYLLSFINVREYRNLVFLLENHCYPTLVNYQRAFMLVSFSKRFPTMNKIILQHFGCEIVASMVEVILYFIKFTNR